MGFESPGYLWGLLAAGIPLLLHLINRRKAQVHDFAAIEFLLSSNRRVARRLRLKQWLLMGVRMLLIAALPLAFSKPFLTRPATTLVATTVPASVVFVVDPSLSMGFRIGDESLLDRALERAAEIVMELRNESDAAVVLATSPPTALNPRLTFDRRELKEALARIEPTEERADITGALRLAEQILVESGQSRREVILLTDRQETEWDGAARPWSLEHAPSVTIVDVAEGTERRNRAIVGVTAEPDGGGVGRNVRITVDVLNDQPVTFEDNVTVRVGTKTAKGFLRIPPHSTGQKTFTLRVPDMGLKTGTVELVPDALPDDDKRHFVIDFLRRVHVLVVNGSPRTVPYLDEAFFLRAALQPGVDSGSRITPTYVKPDELTPRQLEVVDVVVLANVAALDRAQVQALTAWVKQGGGLLVTAGENVTGDSYNQRFGSLLPLPIRDAQVRTEKPVFFTGVNVAHPAMALFSQVDTASLFSAATSRYVLLDTAAATETAVLLSYTSGAPALVERRVGNGLVTMLTTTIDRDWTQFPFKTSFLPLVQQQILHLGGRLEPMDSRDLVVGEPHRISLERHVEAIEVICPDGRVRHLDGDDLTAGETIFSETGLSGVYSVRQVRAGASEESRFAVYIDPRESQLRATPMAELNSLLSGTSVQPVTEEIGSPLPQRKDDVWPVLLVALFGILSLETWLAWQVA
jgi:hypothetical protein